MKTIAVLTDFSRRSEHAAMFALHLAIKINADILLFNAFQVPVSKNNWGQIDCPFEDYGEIEDCVKKKLSELSRKLGNELKEKSYPGSELPAITYRCEEGAVANSIAELEEDENIVLIVLASHGIDDKSAFMMGNNCRQVIDAATIPLLIVPDNCAIRNIEKFAFATDLVHNDIDYITSVAKLARPFSAEILIANVNPHSHLTKERETAISLFKKEVTQKINYNRVYFRNIPNDNVKKGLEWLIENVKFDVLVLVHRKGDVSDIFFKSSITKNIADHTYIPLLVYPYPITSAPQF